VLQRFDFLVEFGDSAPAGAPWIALTGGVI